MLWFLSKGRVLGMGPRPIPEGSLCAPSSPDARTDETTCVRVSIS